MVALYNEIDPFAANWLSNLIAAGHIAPGAVDRRSIADVRATDLVGATQAHFFAGIGAWSYALRLAGWPDDRPVWTGSCPCQPFSAAGRGRMAEDARHLWPAFAALIADCRPPVVFGEQVASADGRAWLAAVRADLEVLGYAVGSADLCAAGVGAPHIRQRLYWVAYTNESVSTNSRVQRGGGFLRATGDSPPGGVADPMQSGRAARRPESGAGQTSGGGTSQRLVDADQPRSQRWGVGRDGADEWPSGAAGMECWRDADYLACADGKTRVTQSGLHPLAHGATARVGRLRGYGNAIVPQVAATFIRAFMDVTQ